MAGMIYRTWASCFKPKSLNGAFWQNLELRISKVYVLMHFTAAKKVMREEGSYSIFLLPGLEKKFVPDFSVVKKKVMREQG